MNNKQTLNRAHIALWGVIFVLIILQTISVWCLVKLQHRESLYSKNNLAALINKSEEERYRYPVIDVSENRVYVPEARIYLPLTNVTRDMRYDYFDLKDSETVYFSTSSIVGRQTTQADPSCDKMVVLAKPAQAGMFSAYSLIGTIPPTNDGLSTIFVHSDCKIYFGNIKNDLAGAVKAAQQY